jgi:hypothetical protein
VVDQAGHVDTDTLVEVRNWIRDFLEL